MIPADQGVKQPGGRPPMGEEAMEKQVNVRLPDGTYERLGERAQEAGVVKPGGAPDRTGYVRKLIEKDVGQG